jgi:hypothetical protein
MKTLFIFFLTFGIFTSGIHAGSFQTELKLASWDNAPLVVEVGNRQFHKTHQFHVNGLRPGMHHIVIHKELRTQNRTTRTICHATQRNL